MGARRTQEATDGDCWLPAARVLASGEERFVQVSLRIVLSVCRLIVAAVPWFWWVEASQAGCGWAAHTGHRRRLLASCCAGACERRGVVRTGILPDNSAGLPANHRSRAVILLLSASLFSASRARAALWSNSWEDISLSPFFFGVESVPVPPPLTSSALARSSASEELSTGVGGG